MICGVIICHGQLAKEMLNAAEQILGPVEAVHAFSNDKVSPRTLFEAIVDTLESNPRLPTIIMVDLRGGSCWSVARLLTRKYPDMRILTGVNLPMFTSFLTKRRQNDIETLAQMLVNDGHRGIQLEST